MSKEKMQKIASVLDIGLKIVYITNIILGAFYFLVGLIVLSADAWGEVAMDFVLVRTLDDVKITFARDLLTSEPDLRIDALILAIGLILILYVRYVVKLCRQILAPIKEGRPFDNPISNKIKDLAKWYFIFSILMQVVVKLLSYFDFCRYDYTPLLSADKITSITYHFSFDWSFLGVVGVLYLLAYVFKYGELLQKESDETL